FFFQAEDGIRDWSVTGVQTCALPIFGYRNEIPIFFSRRALFIEYLPRDRFGRPDGEENRDLVAIAEVLRALPDIERQRGLAPPGFTAIELHDPVLEHESAQRPGQRLGLEHLKIEPEIPDFVRQPAAQPPPLP